MQDDASLLHRFAVEHADEAFAILVRRHLDLVHSAALRQVGGDAHLAQDVAQTVFTDLARKAADVARHPVLAGWLYTSTHYAAAKAVRAEQRRRRREQAAHAMSELFHERTDDEAWAQVRPTLDAAMQALKAGDRDAILLRFFEGQGFAAIGTRLRLSENAARMRVERALEKLRAQLARRGVRSTAAALAAALASHGVAAAPAGVVATVTGAALTGAACGSSAAALLTLMTANKLPLALAAAVLAGGGSALVVQEHAQSALRADIARLQTESIELASLHATNETLARDAAHVDALRRTAGDLPQLRAEVDALRAYATRLAPTGAPSNTTDARAARTSGGRETAFAPGQLDQPPKPTSQKAPVFPPELRDPGIPGSAQIMIVVGPDGRVREAKAIEASDEAFAAAALEAVKQWTFEPGRKGGHAVNTRLTVPMFFTIRNDESDWF